MKAVEMTKTCLKKWDLKNENFKYYYENKGDLLDDFEIWQIRKMVLNPLRQNKIR